MRKRRLLFNTAGSFVSQAVEIVAGLILPGLILRKYGSETNGLIHSISQFLAVIALLDMGTGRVVETSLYKPLACNNHNMVSQIIASASRFFRRLGIIMAVYAGILCFVYPSFVKQSIDPASISLLIIVLSITPLSHYFFTMTDTRLLNADQRAYVFHGTNIVTQLISFAASIVMIRLNCPIHMLKLTVSVLCLWQPVYLRLYVNSHYHPDRKVRIEGQPIRDRWYGIAQHIEYVALKNTDYLVLTFFSTLENVSVYVIYHMVLNGISRIIQTVKSSFLALLGELWARGESKALEKTFTWFEWIIHTAVVSLFGCTAVLLVPFVMVYTNGVSDAEYSQPLFAVLLTAAFAFESLRTPYHVLTQAAGRYKETQNCHIITTLLNLGISILTVRRFGLIGVAAGTLVSMGYQTVWLALYTSRHLVKNNSLPRRILADLLIIAAGAGLTFRIRMDEIIYGSWLFMAVRVSLIWAAVVLCVNLLLYPEKLKEAWNACMGKLRRFRKV